jgi:hypothetical protein
VETGSAITWKYPSVVLKGDNSVGEFYSVALTNQMQQADTGTKMVHVGKNTRSRIVSKGISAGTSRNCYRGLVQVCFTLFILSIAAEGSRRCVCSCFCWSFHICCCGLPQIRTVVCFMSLSPSCTDWQCHLFSVSFPFVKCLEGMCTCVYCFFFGLSGNG